MAVTCTQHKLMGGRELQDAVSALDTLKPADINYVKKLGNPPFVIKLVLEAVCVLLGEKPARVKDESGKMAEDYWKTSVVLLNNDKVRVWDEPRWG
jgi:dynein heavy chain